MIFNFNGRSTSSLAQQCHDQAREQLDPELTAFMTAVGLRFERLGAGEAEHLATEKADRTAMMLTSPEAHCAHCSAVAKIAEHLEQRAVQLNQVGDHAADICSIAASMIRSALTSPPSGTSPPDLPNPDAGKTLTHVRAAMFMSYIAKNAAAWAGDLLTLEEQALQPVEQAAMARFVSAIEGKLSLLSAAPLSNPTA